MQKEFAGTESKAETEKMLRQAMEDYENKKFVAKADNITLGGLLDMWAEEELKTGTLSNGTVENYLQAINRIKQHPVSERKLKTVTSEHLQQFMDLLTFGGTVGTFVSKGYSKDYIPVSYTHLDVYKRQEKYRRRLSPYCSVASLYFWAVAGGAIPEMKDYAPKRSDRKNERTRKTASNSKAG